MQVLLPSSTIQNSKANRITSAQTQPTNPSKTNDAYDEQLLQQQHNQIFNTTANERYTNLAKY